MIPSKVRNTSFIFQTNRFYLVNFTGIVLLKISSVEVILVTLNVTTQDRSCYSGSFIKAQPILPLLSLDKLTLRQFDTSSHCPLETDIIKVIQVYLILLCSGLLCFTDVGFFTNSTSKKITTCFEILTLLWWTGNEPPSPRYSCTYWYFLVVLFHDNFRQNVTDLLSEKSISGCTAALEDQNSFRAAPVKHHMACLGRQLSNDSFTSLT